MAGMTSLHILTPNLNKRTGPRSSMRDDDGIMSDSKLHSLVGWHEPKCGHRRTQLRHRLDVNHICTCVIQKAPKTRVEMRRADTIGNRAASFTYVGYCM